MPRTRFTRLVGLAVGLGAVLTLTVSGSAEAQVNTFGPHHVFPYGDCSVDLGNIKTANGAARGGADISCNHYRGFINAKVDLYRWNGYRWVDMTSSGWVSVRNTYRLSVGTTHQVCGGAAYWDDVVTVNVDGYQTTFDLGNALGYYPQYDPPC